MNLDFLNQKLRRLEFEPIIKKLSLNFNDSSVWSKLTSDFEVLETEMYYVYTKNRKIIGINEDARTQFYDVVIYKNKSDSVILVEYNKYYFTGTGLKGKTNFVNEGDTFIERIERWENGKIVEKMNNILRDFKEYFKGDNIDKDTILGAVLLALKK